MVVFIHSKYRGNISIQFRDILDKNLYFWIHHFSNFFFSCKDNLKKNNNFVLLQLTSTLVEQSAAFTGQLFLSRNGVKYFRELALC